jgi:hypothetical protein
MKLDIGRFFRRRGRDIPSTDTTIPGDKVQDSEIGHRSTPENSLKYLYRQMWVDPDLRQAVLDIRQMDREDGRVKKLHKRMANTAVKGGLKLKTSSKNKRIIRQWKQFIRRLQLNNNQKLFSDARALAMEGNLALQVVLRDGVIGAAVRMPSETILPLVEANGQFKDVRHAYDQIDLTTGQPIASFALWQLQIARLNPDSFDDMGALGRPYLDASRDVWRKLRMTETDLVIRRRHRAPLRLAHTLEGATKEELEDYREQVEAEKGEITTDFYLNRKGGVAAVQGDAALDQIADVNYLLDTFYAGSPAPKGLFGYTGDLARDILEDLKRDYFDEIDAMQDTQASLYDQIFRLDLLLHGINPENYEFEVVFSERVTATPNQRADLALKYKALGVPNEIVWDHAGLNPSDVLAQRKAEADSNDPYPEETAHGPQRVSITPGNERKSESGTSISNG